MYTILRLYCILIITLKARLEVFMRLFSVANKCIPRYKVYSALRCMTTTEPPLKKTRQMATIGTHSGSFHCDEALGCWLLQQTDRFKTATIVRSRDPAVLAGLDVVIDVGGVYDEATLRFDHHQRGFEHVIGFGGFKTKLSSAGLVYKVLIQPQ